MAKSRTAPLLLFLLAPAPAAAQPATAEAAIEAQRRQLSETIRSDCAPAADEEEIVVCGTRREDRHRLPLPIEAGAGLAANRAGGEQRSALAIDSGRCSTVGPNPQCTQGVDVIGIAFTVARAIAQALIDPDR